MGPGQGAVMCESLACLQDLDSQARVESDLSHEILTPL